MLDGIGRSQGPGPHRTCQADIAALCAISGAIGEIPGVDLTTIADELARARDPVDYFAEAEALLDFAGAGVLVPRPIPEASSERVLTMTRIDGERLTCLDRLTAADDLATRDRLLGELVDEVAAQILVRGHVHADPHPGNYLVTPDHELAILDFGCTLEIPPDERRAYARLVIAIAGGNHAAAGAELAILGFTADDPARLVDIASSLIGALKPGMTVSELDWQAAFAEQIANAKKLGGLAIPRSFVLLGRVLAGRRPARALQAEDRDPSADRAAPRRGDPLEPRAEREPGILAADVRQELDVVQARARRTTGSPRLRRRFCCTDRRATSPRSPTPVDAIRVPGPDDEPDHARRADDHRVTYCDRSWLCFASLASRHIENWSNGRLTEQSGQASTPLVDQDGLGDEPALDARMLPSAIQRRCWYESARSVRPTAVELDRLEHLIALALVREPAAIHARAVLADDDVPGLAEPDRLL